jgi:adenine C2-methylase RlmN of 23S rRNA A2503 and tRNA A37
VPSVKKFNMENVENTQKIIKIINEYKNSSNKELEFVMDFIQDDFNKTKENIIKLTEHLDKIEVTYNLILKEYQKRTKVNG